MRSATFATLVLLVLAVPLALEAQTGRVYRIGVLSGGTRPSPTAPSMVQTLTEGLRDLGWVEGKNIKLEARYAEGKLERLSDLAADLIHAKVDVIVTFGTPAAVAAKQATPTVPIVLGAIGDPVRAGLVTSLARPGGNVTGNSLIAPELGLKRLELLREAVPKARRIGLPYDPANPMAGAFRGELDAAARSLGLELYPMVVKHPDELEGSLSAAVKAGVDALLIFSDPVFFSARARIVTLALQHRLPAMSEGKEFVEAGGFISYSPSLPALARRAAVFVDKILRGTKPGELPIEQPSKFELVVNLKTAKAIGLAVPASVLGRADQLIE